MGQNIPSEKETMHNLRELHTQLSNDNPNLNQEDYISFFTVFKEDIEKLETTQNQRIFSSKTWQALKQVDLKITALMNQKFPKAIEAMHSTFKKAELRPSVSLSSQTNGSLVGDAEIAPIKTLQKQVEDGYQGIINGTDRSIDRYNEIRQSHQELLTQESRYATDATRFKEVYALKLNKLNEKARDAAILVGASADLFPSKPIEDIEELGNWVSIRLESFKEIGPHLFHFADRGDEEKCRDMLDKSQELIDRLGEEDIFLLARATQLKNLSALLLKKNELSLLFNQFEEGIKRFPRGIIALCREGLLTEEALAKLIQESQDVLSPYLDKENSLKELLELIGEDLCGEKLYKEVDQLLKRKEPLISRLNDDFTSADLLLSKEKKIESLTGLSWEQRKNIREGDSYPQIVGALGHVRAWALENYPINSRHPKETADRMTKYRDRVDHIARAYGKEYIRTARGDGNCFYNAGTGILMHVMENRPDKRSSVLEILKLASYKDNPGYIKGYFRFQFSGKSVIQLAAFDKDRDFTVVISGVEKWIKGEETLESLRSMPEFVTRFSRVIRYVTQMDDYGKDDTIDSFITGEEEDISMITKFNEVFDLHCAAVSVSGGYDYKHDTENSQEVWMVTGKDRQESVDFHGQKFVDFDGVILRTDNHFVGMM